MAPSKGDEGQELPQANRHVQSSLGEDWLKPKPRPTRAGAQIENLPCRGSLKRSGQNRNHGGVTLHVGDDELKVIRLRVPNRARAPFLVINLEKVKTFHGCVTVSCLENTYAESFSRSFCE